MRKVVILNERRDEEPPTQGSGLVRNSKRDADGLLTNSRSTYGFYVNCCYHPSTNWIVQYLVGNTSKEEDGKIVDVITTPCRVDSGVGLDLLGQDAGHPSLPSPSTPPIPITLNLCFEDGTSTKHLAYLVYSKWSNINSLLEKLAVDGIIVHTLWDVNEDMRIESGDWDARIQPGTVIDAWCCNDDWGDRSDDEDDSCDSESGEEMGSGCAYDVVKDRSGEHPWWFARWRERVEKDRQGRRREIAKPSWFVMVVWCTSMVAGIVVFSLVY